MPQYTLEDTETKRRLVVEGDQPPGEADIEALFKQAERDPQIREEWVKEGTWRELSAGDKALSDLGRGARAAGMGTADTLKGAAVMQNSFAPLGALGGTELPYIPMLGEAQRLQERTPQERRALIANDPLTRKADEVRAATDKAFPTIQPESVKRPMGAVAEGVGSTFSFAPGMVLGPGGAAILGALQAGGSAYDDALAKGASQDAAELAFFWNATGGTSESVPIASIFERINKASGGALFKAIKDIAASGFEEGAQEVFQQTLSNTVAKHLYDEDRNYLEGVADAGGMGAGTGILLSALGIGAHRTASGVSNRMARKDDGAPQQAKPAVQLPTDSDTAGSQSAPGQPQPPAGDSTAPLIGPDGKPMREIKPGEDVVGAVQQAFDQNKAVGQEKASEMPAESGATKTQTQNEKLAADLGDLNAVINDLRDSLLKSEIVKNEAQTEVAEPAEPAPAEDVSAITNAETEDAMVKALGEVVAVAKTKEEIAQAKAAASQWKEDRKPTAADVIDAAMGGAKQSPSEYLKSGRKAQAEATNPTFETITPSNDRHLGKNAAGEDVYERTDGKGFYRMLFDRPKSHPQGYPDHGGDLAVVEATSASPAPAGPTKEPWQMTKAEWAEHTRAKYAADNADMKAKGFSGEIEPKPDAHYYTVKHAFEKGKPVPPEVLADYPDLAQKQTSALPAKPAISATDIVDQEMGKRGKAKEPWQMTREEYISRRPDNSIGNPVAKSTAEIEAKKRGTQFYAEKVSDPVRNSAGKVVEPERWRVKRRLSSEEKAKDHKEWVDAAVEAGKPVPAEVLKDYPDLLKREPATPKAAVEKGEAVAQPVVKFIQEGKEIRAEVIVPKAMMPGHIGRFAYGTTPKTESGDFIISSGWVLSRQQALEKLRQYLDPKEAEISGSTQEMHNRFYQEHEQAAQPIRVAIEEFFRQESTTRKDTAIADLQASGTPAIWVDDQVITPNGKHAVEDNGRLKRVQDLSQAGFDKNLQYIADALENNPGNEGKWWGANKAARERIAQIKAEREAKDKAEADKKAAEQAETTRKLEEWRAYQTEIEQVQLPKGKQIVLEVNTEKGEKLSITGTAYGDFIVHKIEGGKGKYSNPTVYKVTHIKSGLGVSGGGFPTKAQALNYVRALIHAKVKTDWVKQEVLQRDKPAYNKFLQVGQAWAAGGAVPDYYKASKPTPSPVKPEPQAEAQTGDAPEQNDETRIPLSRAEVEDMLERAWNSNLQHYYDDNDPNDPKTWREWVEKFSAYDVALVLDSDYEIYMMFLRNLPDAITAQDVIEAYKNGGLSAERTAQSRAPQIPLSDIPYTYSGGLGEPRKTPPMPADRVKALWQTATQRATKKTAPAVTSARKTLLIQSHVQKLNEALGLPLSKINQAFRSWSNYPSGGRDIAKRLNQNVPEVSEWTGIQNSAFLSRVSVSPSDVDQFVKDVDASDESGWETPNGESLRRYIARAFLALDTRIDWGQLSFKVLSTLKPRGLYESAKRLITIRSNSPHTVAHEIGHHLDHKWSLEAGIDSMLSDGTPNLDIVAQKTSPERALWVKRFQEFVMDIAKRSDIGSEYLQSRREVFARFIDKFVRWTEDQAGARSWGEDNYSNDKFTQQDFTNFVRLLQEKAFVDAKDGNPLNNKIKPKEDIRTESRGDALRKRAAERREKQLPEFPEEANKSWRERAKKKQSQKESYTKGVLARAVASVVHGDALPKAFREARQWGLSFQKYIEESLRVLTLDARKALHAEFKTKEDRQAAEDRLLAYWLGEAELDTVGGPALQRAAEAFRQTVDDLTTLAVRNGLVPDQLSETWLENRGAWLKRTYLAFDPTADWNYDTLKRRAEKGDKEIRRIWSGITNYLMSQDPKLTPDQLKAVMKSLINRREVEDILGLGAQPMAGSGKRFSVDIGSLLRRKDLPIEVREWMGQIKDPFARGLQSGKWMAQFITRNLVQRKFANLGMEMGLLSNEFTGDYTEELYPNVNQLVPKRDEEGNAITTEDGDVVAEYRQKVDRRREPLHGFYTSPEFVAALQEFDGTLHQMRGALDVLTAVTKLYLKGIGYIKAAKVGLNPYSYMLNTLGGVVMRLAAGGVNPVHFKDAFSAIASGKNPVDGAMTAEQARARMNYLLATKAGVTGRGVLLGDVRTNLERDTEPEEFKRALAAIRAILSDPKGGGAWVRLRDALTDIAQIPGNYGIKFMDDVFRVSAFLDELALARKAFPDQSEQQHVEWAADRASNIYQTYDRLLPLLRGLSRASLLNTFISFKFELFRNTYWIAKYAAQGISSDNAALKQDGYQKAVGLMAMVAAPYALAALSRAANDTDDDEVQAFQRWAVPPWDRGEELVIGSKNGTQWRYVPMGYMLPHYEITRAINAGWKASKDPNPDIALRKAMQGMAADYFGPGAFVGPGGEAIFNKRLGGGQITYAEGWQGAKDRAAYLRRAWGPNIGDPLYQAYMGVTDQKGTYGREYDIAEVGLKLAGIRVRTVDVARQLPFSMREFGERWKNATAYANIAKRKYPSDQGRQDVAEAYRVDTQAELKRQYAQFHRDMLKLGVSEQQFLIAEKEVTLPKELKYSRIAQ